MAGFLPQCSDLSSQTPARLCWISCLKRPRLRPPLLCDGWVLGVTQISPVCGGMERIKVHLFLLLQVLSCFATLLRKQDASVWTYPSTLQAYHGLLSFTVHTKPKVCLLSTPLHFRRTSSVLHRRRRSIHISMCFRSVEQHSRGFALSSEGATSCSQITPRLTILLRCPQLNSASKKWSAQEVRQSIRRLSTLLLSCPANFSPFLTPSLRQQRRHHHTSRAGAPEGADGDVSSRSCQIMLRDSAASDDTQPCGENTNSHKCSQVLPSLFLNPADVLAVRSW